MDDILPFKIIRTADHEAMSQAAVARITAQLRRKPDSLLILATGGTPERTYQLLADRGRAEPGLCDRLRIIKLDEWGGQRGEKGIPTAPFAEAGNHPAVSCLFSLASRRRHSVLRRGIASSTPKT